MDVKADVWLDAPQGTGVKAPHGMGSPLNRRTSGQGPMIGAERGPVGRKHRDSSRNVGGRTNGREMLSRGITEPFRRNTCNAMYLPLRWWIDTEKQCTLKSVFPAPNLLCPNKGLGEHVPVPRSHRPTL